MFPAGVVDDALSALIVDSISPLALEVALNVQPSSTNSKSVWLRLTACVASVQYDAEQARIRYMRVDPNKRLVADTLEGTSGTTSCGNRSKRAPGVRKQRESAERTISQQQKDQSINRSLSRKRDQT
jgi:hypothetical protein